MADRAALHLVVDDTPIVETTTRVERRMTALRPEWISQRTSEAVLGLDARGYLETLTAYREAGGEVVALGKRRLVHLASFVAWLRRRGETTNIDVVDDNEVDDYAAELGLVAGGKR